MNKFGVVLIVTLLIAYPSYGIEVFPGVWCKFDRWLTIKEGNTTLEHSESSNPRSVRDYVTTKLGDKSVFILDFDGDNVIDIIFINGKALSRQANPNEYAHFEMMLTLWKSEVHYEVIVEMWRKERLKTNN